MAESSQRYMEATTTGTYSQEFWGLFCVKAAVGKVWTSDEQLPRVRYAWLPPFLKYE